MKKYLLSTTLIFTIVFCSKAKQDSQAKFGKIEQADVEMTTYDRDPAAAALVLHDEGSSTFVYNQTTGFDIHFERHTRIKILTKNGYDWANFEIPLYGASGDREALQRISGFTYNMVNGKVERTKVEKSAVLYEELNEYWTIAKLAFPDVKEGSVVEVYYTVSSPYTSQLRSWEFQATIPVRWSQYTVKIPEYFSYLKFTQGYEPFEYVKETLENQTITLHYNERSDGYTAQSKPTVENITVVSYVTAFAAKDLPAFEEEDFITRPDDYFLKVEYQLASVKWPNQPTENVLGDWAQVEDKLLTDQRFGLYVKRRGPYKALAEEILQKATTDKDKVALAAQTLTSQVSWNGKNRMMATENSKMLEDKSGSSADINLFFVGLLQELGLQAYPVIISTRGNGKVHPVHPIIDKYNYVIAQVVVDGKELLVDLTDPLVPLGLLPEKCLNELGRRIDKTNPGWVNLSIGMQSAQTYSLDMVINDQGDIVAAVQRKAEGYFAIESSRKLRQDGEDEYKKEILERVDDWTINEIQVESKDAVVFTEQFKISTTSSEASGADILYIETMPFLKIAENPFKQDERMYPIDFRFPTKNILMAKIEVPSNYKIEEIPQQKTFALPSRGGLFTYSVTTSGNTINIYSRFDINKSLYLPDQYAFIKAAYDQIIEAHSQQIVLKKL